MKTRTCATDGYVEKAYESFAETTLDLIPEEWTE